MTESQVTQATSGGVSFGAEFVEEPSILARVSIDTTVASTKSKSGEQVLYTIKPLDFETKGDGLSTYINKPLQTTAKIRQPDGSFKISTGYSKKSGIWIVLEAFHRVFFPRATAEELKNLAIGEGKLVGLVGWFRRTEVKFGQDADGHPIVATYFLPLYPATEAEIAAAGHDGGAVMTSQPGLAAAAPVEVSDDLAQELLSFMAGKARARYTRDAFKAQDLSAEAKDLIASGKAASILVERGLAQEDGDGVLSPVAVEA